MDVAMFRYGLIAPILQNTVDDPAAYLADISAKTHDVPHYGQRSYSKKTIQRWIVAYKRDNLDALKPRVREDKNISRVISPETSEEILRYRQAHPNWSVKLLYEQMLKEDLIAPGEFSYHTFYRFLRGRSLAKSQEDSMGGRERRKFAFDEVNRLWQGDMMVGPYLHYQGRRQRSYLFAFIDDASRLIPFAAFTFEQNLEAMKRIYMEAVIRRGIPKLVYFDNGKVYRSAIFQEALARMGTTVIHTQPYDAASKGKIERYFSTVRKRFLPLVSTEMLSLEEFNQAFWQWLEEDYHRRQHAGIGMSPLDKYMSQAHQLKMVSDPDGLKYLFMRREQRRVNGDSTIAHKNKFFEAPVALIGQKVEIRFNPDEPDEIFIFKENALVCRATPVNQADNARVKRKRESNEEEKSSISFSAILAKKEGS